MPKKSNRTEKSVEGEATNKQNKFENEAKESGLGTVSLLALHRTSEVELIDLIPMAQEQEANLKDVERLLRQFCDLYYLKEMESMVWDRFPSLGNQLASLTQYVCRSLHLYLSGERKSLEAAFGLKGKRGGRENLDLKVRRSYLVWKLRVVEGLTYEDAVTKIAESDGSRTDQSLIKKAFNSAWGEGFDMLLLEQARKNNQGSTWTPEEKNRLSQMFEDRKKRV